MAIAGLNREFPTVIKMRTAIKGRVENRVSPMGLKGRAISVKILIGEAIAGEVAECVRGGGRGAGPTRSVKSGARERDAPGHQEPYYLLSHIIHARKFPRQRVRRLWKKSGRQSLFTPRDTGIKAVDIL